MDLHQTIIPWLDRLLPAGLVRAQPTPELLRARTLAAFLVVLMLLGLVYIPLLYLGSQGPVLGHTTIFAWGVNLVLLAIFRQTRSAPLVAHLFALVLLAELAWSLTLMGGFGSSALMWTALAPVVVTLLAGFRAGVAWTVAAAALTTTFFVLDRNGVVFVSELSPAEAKLVGYVSHLALPAVMVVLCFCYERLRILAESEARQERDLVRTVFDANEVDRRLFAFEIHDGVMPLLAGAAMRLDGMLSRASGRDQADLDEIRTLIGRAIVEARQIMSGLRPPVLDEMGLGAGIDFLASDYRQRCGLNVHVALDPGVGRLEPTVENALFRICQEALTNVVKHSGVLDCHISLRQQDGQLQVSICDGGHGFEPQPQNARLGLRGIRERARLLGGKAEVTSSVGQGTLIRVAIPIEHCQRAQGVRA